ncbi:hypothetical protein I314_02996 [Cryptococcus bacillisporus CA1873]|uniref:Uncharacterized protein n=1 Tax=Cryptococcus bacillisporus CA1873 TaxID=1296111 RepID=A0ABR5BBA3_CRYGA|nr:hypothetical protein I314_02996 [Cryptococcus bacillisporus CA1873]|eukprot:KIR63592.1 hypothetical protein I314_02996 [Cryptococcus gattii CA1873]
MTYEDVEDCAVFGAEVTVGDDDYEIVEGGVNGTGDSGGAEEVLVTDRFETQEAQVMAAAFGRCAHRLPTAPDIWEVIYAAKALGVILSL